MEPKIITIKGKPHLVIISYEEYQGLLDLAKKPKQVQAPRRRLHSNKPNKQSLAMNDAVPEEVQRRISKGESAVKAWRLYRDLTQAELAKLAGVSSSTISLIENKERSGSVETRIAIARTLNVPETVL